MTIFVSVIALGCNVVSLVYFIRLKEKFDKLNASVIAARLMGNQNTQADTSPPGWNNQQIGAAMSQLATQTQQNHNSNLAALVGASGVVTGTTILNAGSGYGSSLGQPSTTQYITTKSS